MERKTLSLEDVEHRFIGMHRKAYVDWLRHIVTLAASMLAALIALQGQYLPRTPHWHWLLAVCWVALATCILLGLVAMRAEYGRPLKAFAKLRTVRVERGDVLGTLYVQHGDGEPTSTYQRWATDLLLPMFVLALLALCSFAVANLL